MQLLRQNHSVSSARFATSMSEKCHSLRRGAGRLLNLLVVAACAVIANSSPAQAETCGHYLFRNGRPVHSQATTGQSPDTTATDALAAPGLPIEPCQGLGCREHSIPLSVPAPVSAELIERPADAILQILASFGEGYQGWILPESETGELMIAPGIFRPPAC
jgi:hypothetical protein